MAVPDAWQEFDGFDAFPGSDVCYLKTQDIGTCKQQCVEKGYGGFVYYRGYAYFRSQKPDELLQARRSSWGSRLFVRRVIPSTPAAVAAVPTVAATVVAAVPATAAAPATPAAPAAPATPAVAPAERLDVPPTPQSFPALAQLNESELVCLRDNAKHLEDWILEDSRALPCREKLRQLHEQNLALAEKIKAFRPAFEEAKNGLEKSCSELEKCQETVRVLRLQEDEARQRNAPAKLAAVLDKAAKEVDVGAETMLEEALDGAAMDAAALTKFRQQFMESKMEKHRKLALKERLLVS